MNNFSRTISIFFQNKYQNPYKATAKHILWQFRKLLNNFPCDLYVNSLKVRIKDLSIANSSGALINGVGYYDPNNMYFLERIFSNNLYSTFFDVGANIGFYSLIAAKSSCSKIFAFEPHPYTYQLMNENIQINNFSNKIKSQPYALGCIDGIVSYTDFPGSSLNHVIENPAAKTIEVKITRGDSFCNKYLLVPEVIKIDVEGYENEVIMGFGSLIEKAHILLIECNKVQEIANYLCTKKGFYGPYKIDYRIKVFTKSNIHKEDWIFISSQAKANLSNIGFRFEEGNINTYDRNLRK